MTELMENDPTNVHVDCDLGGCINEGKLQAKFPDRVFNAGIAEQNAVGVASGMAAAGMKAFVHSFGCFAARLSDHFPSTLSLQRYNHHDLLLHLFYVHLSMYNS